MTEDMDILRYAEIGRLGIMDQLIESEKDCRLYRGLVIVTVIGALILVALRPVDYDKGLLCLAVYCAFCVKGYYSSCEERGRIKEKLGQPNDILAVYGYMSDPEVPASVRAERCEAVINKFSPRINESKSSTKNQSMKRNDQ